jgi:beta-glucanase (GH16 family)
LDPVKSALIHSSNSFSFKYGKVEISAKMPTGDWLAPSISLLPKNNAYGNWPASGRVDLVQSKGNRELFKNKTNIGVEQIESSVQFGPYEDLDTKLSFQRAAKEKEKGFNSGFHRFQLEWSESKIVFSVDDIETGTLKAGKQSFWDKGNFETKAPGTFNPWPAKMAPFDQNFYFVINLAVGGKTFADDLENIQPWEKDSSNAKTEFWQAKNVWLPTWKSDENKTETSFLIDYIRVWAL